MITADEPFVDALGHQWVDAAPFRALLRHLMTTGRVGAADLAALAGVSRHLVEHLVNGRRGKPVRRISPANALALLQLDAPRVRRLRKVLVPASVARERLERLRRAGWSDVDVAVSIGAGPGEFQSILRSGGQCSELTLVRLRALCRDLDADDELDLELDARTCTRRFVEGPASSRWMPRQADEDVIPGRLVTEEKAARRRPGGAGHDEPAGVSPGCAVAA